MLVFFIWVNEAKSWDFRWRRGLSERELVLVEELRNVVGVVPMV